MKTYEKAFNVIGWLGFVVLMPVNLHVFGVTGPINVLGRISPVLGNPSTLATVAFALTFLMAIFGCGDTIGATLLGMLVGFLLIASALDVSFMRWLPRLTERLGFRRVPEIAYLAGVAALFIGIIISYFKRVPFLVELLAIVIVPLAFLVTSRSLDMFHSPSAFDVSLSEGVGSLLSLVDSRYRHREEIEQYVEEIAHDASLEEDAKIALIRELQARIRKLDRDRKALEAIQEENEKYREQIEGLKDDVDSFDWCAASRETSDTVAGFAAAVRSDYSCVRDFAVHLAKAQDGPYSIDRDGFPGPVGIRQICTIHTYLASRWSYVSDPTVTPTDYFSPADRTIALGLAGDCDDFAIVMASCIEAIGGRVRVVSGVSDGIGHAWCEVFIGSAEDWERAVSEAQDFYRRSSRRVNGIAEGGEHWLSQDWRLGEYTCEDPGYQIEYESPWA